MIKTLQDAKRVSLDMILQMVMGGIAGDPISVDVLAHIQALSLWKITATSMDREDFDKFAHHNITGFVANVKHFIEMRAKEEGLDQAPEQAHPNEQN